MSILLRMCGAISREVCGITFDPLEIPRPIDAVRGAVFPSGMERNEIRAANTTPLPSAFEVMQFQVCRSTDDLKITPPVICPITIPVVNDFIGSQFASHFRLEDESVFQDPTAITASMKGTLRRGLHKDVSVVVKMSSSHSHADSISQGYHP